MYAYEVFQKSSWEFPGDPLNLEHRDSRSSGEEDIIHKILMKSMGGVEFALENCILPCGNEKENVCQPCYKIGQTDVFKMLFSFSYSMLCRLYGDHGSTNDRPTAEKNLSGLRKLFFGSF